MKRPDTGLRVAVLVELCIGAVAVHHSALGAFVFAVYLPWSALRILLLGPRSQ